MVHWLYRVLIYPRRLICSTDIFPHFWFIFSCKSMLSKSCKTKDSAMLSENHRPCSFSQSLKTACLNVVQNVHNLAFKLVWVLLLISILYNMSQYIKQEKYNVMNFYSFVVVMFQSWWQCALVNLYYIFAASVDRWLLHH